MSFCAPSRGQNKWTCFTLEELEIMCTALNKTELGESRPIDVSSLKSTSKDNQETYKKLLWTALRDRFYPYCGDNESCWLDSVDLGKQLSVVSPAAYKILNHFTLKPKGTKKKNGWLSTTEIDYVMEQFVEIFPDFKYIGCFPSDYYKLSPNKFPKDILDKHAKAAIVFNLDESHQSGSHWVTVFFDVDETTGERKVEYFDPTGDPPNKNIEKFLRHPYFADSILIINKKGHQKGNTECGVYSLFYILERMNGSSMEEINNKRIPDGEMNNFRSVLFRPWTPKYKF